MKIFIFSTLSADFVYFWVLIVVVVTLLALKMFFKTCTILMTVIVACHSACNTRVELCDETISKKFLEESRLEPTPLGFVSKHHLRNIRWFYLLSHIFISHISLVFIALSQPMHREKSAIAKNLNIYFENLEPKKVVKKFFLE